MHCINFSNSSSIQTLCINFMFFSIDDISITHRSHFINPDLNSTCCLHCFKRIEMLIYYCNVILNHNCNYCKSLNKLYDKIYLFALCFQWLTDVTRFSLSLFIRLTSYTLWWIILSFNQWSSLLVSFMSLSWASSENIYQDCHHSYDFCDRSSWRTL